MIKTQMLWGIVVIGVMLSAMSAADGKRLEKATFAGGCFWCMEEAFDKVDGVVSTLSGYTGGRKANPTYEEVSAGGTGHAESVEVMYDPTKVSYVANSLTGGSGRQHCERCSAAQ